MAHMIDGNRVAWRGQKPWHGLGNQIQDGDSLEVIQHKAGLEWEVLSCPIMAVFRNLFRPLPNDRAIMRDIDGKRYMLASKDYVPVQNRQILEFFRSFCDAAEMQIEVVGALKEGAVVWALAKTADGFTLPGGDTTGTYLTLVNSHDGSLALQAYFTNIRIVCWNTMRMAMQARKANRTSAKPAAEFYRRHTSAFDEAAMKQAKKMLGLAHERTEQFGAQAELLAGTQITTDEMDLIVYRLTQADLFNRVMEETSAKTKLAVANGNALDMIVAASESDSIINRLREEKDHNRAGREILTAVLSSPGSDLASSRGTCWGVLNGVTWYSDHVAGKTDDARLTSAWFGSKADLKQDALELVVAYAEAARS